MSRNFLVGMSLGILLVNSAGANAPVATLDTGTPVANSAPVVSAAPIIIHSSTDTTPTPKAVNALSVHQAPVPQVVDSQAMLASLTPDQRIARLENQVKYLNTYTNQINGLSTQIDMLRGQIEDLHHQITGEQKQIDALTQKITALSKPVTKDTTLSDTNAPAQPSAAEQTAYQNAYNLMAKKQYAPATKSFNSFLKQYPKSSLASNAHYWLGDLYLAQGQPDNASQQFRAVISNQDAAKRPDAMVKLGTILLAYGDNAHAKDLLQGVIKQYPNTSQAKQAKQRLQSMQSASVSTSSTS